MKNLAVPLDRAGRPKQEAPFDKPGVLVAYGSEDAYDEALVHAPEQVKGSLDRAGELAGPFEPRGSAQSWLETLYNPLADGGTITTPASETIMFPIFTLPANYLYPGRALRWTIFGRMQTVITTPGTQTFKLSYSASGVGAVTLASSGAFAPDPTAASTTLTFMVEWWTLCRSSGTSGTGLTCGRVEWRDYDNASIDTLIANLEMRMAPQSAPATAAIDTTVARALSPTYTPSVTTGSLTAHMGFLEAMT